MASRDLLAVLNSSSPLIAPAGNWGSFTTAKAARAFRFPAGGAAAHLDRDHYCMV